MTVIIPAPAPAPAVPTGDRVPLRDDVLTVYGGLLAVTDGAVVNVYLADTTTLAPIYAAETGGTTRAQPLTTNDGRIESALAPGEPLWVDSGVPLDIVGTYVDRLGHSVPFGPVREDPLSAISVTKKSGRVGAVIAGAPTDLSWLAATGRGAIDGDEALDSTNALEYVRVGGAWRYAPLTPQGVLATGAGVLVNGAVTDANFLAAAGRAAVDGDRAVDYANGRWYARVAGAWQYAALSSPAVFTPASISGLYAWYDASQITGKADGDAISQWDDLSGNARHAVQATTANQPRYKAAIQNGKPVVRFDGVDDFLTAAIGATLAQPYTIIVVGRASTGTSTNENFVTGSGGIYIAGRSSGGGIYSIQGGTPFTNFGTGRKENAFKLVVGVYNGASSEVRVNGLSQTGSIGTVGLGTPINFGSLSGTSEFLNGDLAEVLIYNKVLSAPEMAQIEAYLG